MMSRLKSPITFFSQIAASETTSNNNGGCLSCVLLLLLQNVNLCCSTTATSEFCMFLFLCSSPLLWNVTTLPASGLACKLQHSQLFVWARGHKGKTFPFLAAPVYHRSCLNVAWDSMTCLNPVPVSRPSASLHMVSLCLITILSRKVGR